MTNLDETIGYVLIGSAVAGLIKQIYMAGGDKKSTTFHGGRCKGSAERGNVTSKAYACPWED